MERGRFTEGLNTLHFQVVADMEQVRPKYVILPGGGGDGQVRLEYVILSGGGGDGQVRPKQPAIW